MSDKLNNTANFTLNKLKVAKFLGTFAELGKYDVTAGATTIVQILRGDVASEQLFCSGRNSGKGVFCVVQNT